MAFYYLCMEVQGRRRLFEQYPAFRRLTEETWKTSLDRCRAVHAAEFSVRGHTLNAIVRTGAPRPGSRPKQPPMEAELGLEPDVPAYKVLHAVIPHIRQRCAEKWAALVEAEGLAEASTDLWKPEFEQRRIYGDDEQKMRNFVMQQMLGKTILKAEAGAGEDDDDDWEDDDETNTDWLY